MTKKHILSTRPEKTWVHIFNMYYYCYVVYGLSGSISYFYLSHITKLIFYIAILWIFYCVRTPIYVIKRSYFPIKVNHSFILKSLINDYSIFYKKSTLSIRLLDNYLVAINLISHSDLADWEKEDFKNIEESYIFKDWSKLFTMIIYYLSYLINIMNKNRKDRLCCKCQLINCVVLQKLILYKSF